VKYLPIIAYTIFFGYDVIIGTWADVFSSSTKSPEVNPSFLMKSIEIADVKFGNQRSATQDTLVEV